MEYLIGGLGETAEGESPYNTQDGGGCLTIGVGPFPPPACPLFALIGGGCSPGPSGIHRAP